MPNRRLTVNTICLETGGEIWQEPNFVGAGFKIGNPDEINNVFLC